MTSDCSHQPCIEYGITLKHEALPVVDVGQPRKDGSPRQPVYIPPELCHIPPFLPFYGTLPGNATSEMIKVACRSPFDNATAIVEQGFPILGLKPLPNTSVLPGFDVSISDKMTVVPSRILAPPSISYKGKITSVQDASWNLVGSKFNLGAKMGNWAALLLVDGKASPEERFNGTKDPDLQNLLKSFALKCQNCGMQVSTLQPEIWVTRALPHNPRDNSQTSAVQIIKEAFEDIIRKKKPSFVLVLLPSDSKVIYGGVKLTGDVDLGVHTVCMRIKKARDPKRQAQYFANVALKVNAKLGGINHLVDKSSLEWLTEKKTMLVGIGGYLFSYPCRAYCLHLPYPR